MYADFDLLVPEQLDQALTMIAAAGGDRAALGGGTNLVVEMRASGKGPAALISVGRLPGLRGIRIADGTVTIGASTTVSDILRHPGMEKQGAALFSACGQFAGQMVRNTATVAGNICCGSPAADLVPPLLAMGASVTLRNAAGERTVPLDQYFTGYKTSVRKPDELMTAISWPVPAANSASAFYKLGRRHGDAITMVGVAVHAALKDGVCSDVRIALGAVGPCVFRAKSAEALLDGQAPTADRIAQAAARAMEESSPIDDIRASGAYRKDQVQVLVKRLLTRTIESLS
jgi:carbon-monoxide dehydrogenase medium subunit